MDKELKKKKKKPAPKGAEVKDRQNVCDRHHYHLLNYLSYSEAVSYLFAMLDL